jgi:hypothetical protein
MIMKALLLLNLFLTFLSVQGASSLRRNNENIPFHLKEDSDGNVVAVIDYGRGPADSERTIEVPCDSESKSVGPVIVQCNSVLGVDGSDKTYTLEVPFTFKRDEDGNIIAAVYKEEEIQVIPFRTKRDENGNVVGVIYEPVSDENNSDLFGMEKPWGIILLIAIILTGLGLIGGFFWSARSVKTQESSNGAEKAADDKTESGSCVEG